MDQLKSTPPAWAGTLEKGHQVVAWKLKSTPPAWAGTKGNIEDRLGDVLKSTPPAWAGTSALRALRGFKAA